jgi:hypothetical protein
MKLLKQLHRTLPVLCALCLGMLSTHASALLLRETGTSSGLSTHLSLPVSSSPQSYFSGLQNIEIDNSLDLLAYCIDPFQWAPTANAEYSLRTDFNTFFAARAADIAKLYSLFYSSTLGNNLNAAGFQLALWELTADNKVLSTGVVRTTGSTSSSIRNKAADMLSALSGAGGADQFAYQIYTSAGKQDYLVVTPIPANQVPEPSAHALAVLALGGMLLVSRRRR